MVGRATLWMKSAAVLQILTALIHATSFFAEMEATNNTEAQLIDLFQNQMLDFGAGYQKSMEDIFLSLSISFSLLYLMGGWVNWMALKRQVPQPFIRSLLRINLIIYGAGFLAMLFFAFLPPIVLTGLVFVLLILAKIQFERTGNTFES